MRLIASTLMAGVIALGAVSPALAHPPKYNNSRDWDDRDYRDGYRDGRHDDNWDDRRNYNQGYKNGYKKWRKGDHYSHSHYNYVVVRDYNYYRLPPPRHGHYYVRDDRTGDILLIAAATGLILWALND